MVPKVGLEPTRGCPHGILSPARLPISPLRHKLRMEDATQARPLLSRRPCARCRVHAVESTRRGHIALDFAGAVAYVTARRTGGAVAQLGEHKAGSLGVRGSSPLSSTKTSAIHRHGAGGAGAGPPAP